MKTIIDKIVSITNLSEQEAWWMLEAITKRTKEQLMLMNAQNVSQQEQHTIGEWIKKLTQESMPLAYLIGSVPFLDLTIKVQSPILIPRPETEEWVNNVIKTLTPHVTTIRNILDIGTGSGCIALALAKHFDNAHITATDINPQALQLAQANAKLNNIRNISFVQSDLFANVDKNNCFDLIVSNPPYIDPASKPTMMPQVTQWEDEQALFASHKGLQLIKHIIQEAPSYLCKPSQLPVQLVLEFDYNQHQLIQNLAQQHRWRCDIQKDLFGNDRTAWLTHK